MQEFRQRNLNLIGHTFDGDARLRRAFLTVFGKPPSAAADLALTIDHPLMQVGGPIVEGKPMIAMPDELHLAWRMRTQALDPKRNLDMGGSMVDLAALHTDKEILKLNSADLDPSNKQSYEGVYYV